MQCYAKVKHHIEKKYILSQVWLTHYSLLSSYASMRGRITWEWFDYWTVVCTVESHQQGPWFKSLASCAASWCVTLTFLESFRQRALKLKWWKSTHFDVTGLRQSAVAWRHPHWGLTLWMWRNVKTLGFSFYFNYWLRPFSRHPFFSYQQIALMTVTLFPIRLFIAAFMMLLAWPFAFLASVGRSETTVEPQCLWRRWVSSSSHTGATVHVPTCFFNHLRCHCNQRMAVLIFTSVLH